MLYEVLGDMWVVQRNSYLQYDLLDNPRDTWLFSQHRNGVFCTQKFLRAHVSLQSSHASADALLQATEVGKTVIYPWLTARIWPR